MNGLDRQESTFDRKGVISKRKKWAIFGVAVIVLLAIIIGTAIAVSGKNKNKKNGEAATKPRETLPTTPARTPTAPGSPASSSAASVFTKPYRREVALSEKLSPKLLGDFFNELSSKADGLSIPGLPAFKLPEQMPISFNSMLSYIRDMNVSELYTPLLDFAESGDLKSLKMDDLIPTLKEATKFLDPKGARAAVKAWGAKLADGHTLVAGKDNFPPLNLTSLQGMATKAKSILPKSSVTPEAMKAYLKTANLKTTKPKKSSILGRRLTQAVKEHVGRKLAAGAAPAPVFEDICIPVVFHILQYNEPENNGALFPGPGYVKDAQNLIDVTNYFFANEELTKYFEQPATPTKVQFRLEAVVTDPTEAPYLGLSEEAWDMCAENKTMMGALAEAASATYPQDKYINVFICGDPGDGSGVLGYAFPPRGPVEEFDETEAWRHVFLRIDEFLLTMNNNAEAFQRGGGTLAHELGHHLGLMHPHAPKEAEGTCTDGDGLEDTPTTGVVQLMGYYPDLNYMCDQWRLNDGVWPEPTGYESYLLGDMSSCAPHTTIDPVFNVMEYTAASCYSHFTLQQVEFLQAAIPLYRPQLYNNTMGACPAATNATLVG